MVISYYLDNKYVVDYRNTLLASVMRATLNLQEILSKGQTARIIRYLSSLIG